VRAKVNGFDSDVPERLSPFRRFLLENSKFYALTFVYIFTPCNGIVNWCININDPDMFHWWEEDDGSPVICFKTGKCFNTGKKGERVLNRQTFQASSPSGFRSFQIVIVVVFLLSDVVVLCCALWKWYQWLWMLRKGHLLGSCPVLCGCVVCVSCCFVLLLDVV
jgi:hypothetical protein